MLKRLIKLPLNLLASLIIMVATTSIGTASFLLFYQPSLPKEIKE